MINGHNNLKLCVQPHHEVRAVLIAAVSMLLDQSREVPAEEL
jgi:hypothetical protein